MVAGSNLSWQGIKRKAVYTKGASPVCKSTEQCTEEEVLRVGVQNFFNWLLIYYQLETTKYHMFSM